MRRLVACFVLFSLFCGILSGCGGVTVYGVINPGVATVSGTVCSITLTTLPQNNTTVLVTIVTFEKVLGFSTVNFCGDVRSRFPMNTFTQVNFQPGQPCSSIIVIVISG